MVLWCSKFGWNICCNDGELSWTPGDFSSRAGYFILSFFDGIFSELNFHLVVDNGNAAASIPAPSSFATVMNYFKVLSHFKVIKIKIEASPWFQPGFRHNRKGKIKFREVINQAVDFGSKRSGIC